MSGFEFLNDGIVIDVAALLDKTAPAHVDIPHGRIASGENPRIQGLILLATEHRSMFGIEHHNVSAAANLNGTAVLLQGLRPAFVAATS